MAWKLFAARECDGWHGAIRASGSTDEVLNDEMGALAAVCEDGTLLRAVGDSGEPPVLRVVVSGKAEEIKRPLEARYYLGTEAFDAWAKDPGQWWRDSTEAHYLIKVASTAVVPSDPGTPLHHAVVQAACDCVRSVLPLWQASYPLQDIPLRAISAAERWCAGTCPLREVLSRARGAFDAGWDVRRDYLPRMVAQAAAAASGVPLRPIEAAWAVTTVMQLLRPDLSEALVVNKRTGGSVSKADLVGYVRRRVSLVPVLMGLAGLNHGDI